MAQDLKSWYEGDEPEPTQAPTQQGGIKEWYEQGQREDVGSLRLSVTQALEKPPDQAARVMRIAGRIGAVANDFLESDLDQIEREVLVRDFNFEKWLRESPTVAKRVKESPFFAAAAQEDLKSGKLQALEQAIRRDRSQWPMSQAEIEAAARKSAKRRAQGEFEKEQLVQQNPIDAPPPKGWTSVEDAEKALFERERAERLDEEAFIASDEKAGILETLGRRLRENPLFLAPFLSSSPDLDRTIRLYNAAKAVEAGSATEDEQEYLVRFGRLAEAAERRGQSVVGKVAGVVSELPAFAGEFALTGGAFRLTKGAVEVTIRQALKKALSGTARGLVRKAVAAVPAAAAHTLARAPLRITQEAIERMTPGIALSPDEKGELHAVITAPGDDFLPALSKAAGNQFVESLSERTGGVIERVTGPLKAAIFGRWLKRNPGAPVSQFLGKVKEATGWHGILGEMFEERVGELARAGLGIETYRPPTAEQLLVEALAFSVPGAVAGTARALTHRQRVANPEVFAEIGKNVEALKIRERSPEALEQLVAESVKNTPNEYVYAPIESWVTYWRGKKDEAGQPIDPREMAKDLMGDVAAYDEALRTGEDIPIPTAKYAVHLAPTEHNGFWKDELRQNPLEMTAREAKEFFQTAQEPSKEDVFQAEAERLVAQREPEIVKKAVEAAKAEAKQRLATLQESDIIAQIQKTIAKRIYWQDPKTGKNIEELVKSGIPRHLLADPKKFTKGAGDAVSLDQVADKFGMTSSEVIEAISQAAAARKEAQLGAEVDVVPEDMIRAATEAEMRQAVEDSYVRAESAQAVAGSIAEQLEATGFPKDQAETYAKLYESAFRALGQRADVDPAELFARYGLKISRPDVEAAKGEGRELEQAAFHGTPHQFDKFDISKIGTGEGAQAFGWGLYFSGRKEVAEFYRNKLSSTAPEFEGLSKDENNDLPEWVARVAADAPERIDDLIVEFEQRANDAREALKSSRQPWLERQQIDTTSGVARVLKRLKEIGVKPRKPGRLFKVDIPEDTEYLAWDNELALQSHKVRDAINRFPESLKADVVKHFEDDGFDLSGGLSEAYDITGADLYKAITAFAREGALPGLAKNNPASDPNITDAQEVTSKLFMSLGVPGIKYLDQSSRKIGEGTHNYVVFDDKLIKVLEFEQREFEEGGPRGRIRFTDRVDIELLKKADLSTFIHESGHFYLEVLGDLAGSPRATAELQADYAEALRWFGVQSRKEITREHHEKWARGFEAYLMEGKAPTSALRAAFAKFRAWLVAIYNKLRNLNVELTPQVRGVMDRLLATQEEITAAQAEQNILPLDAQALGLSEKEAFDYQRAVNEARHAAEDELAGNLIKDVKRTQAAWWKEEREKFRAEIAADVNFRREYIAQSALQRGKMPDGEPLPEGMEAPKLSREIMGHLYDAERVKRHAFLMAKDGMHPDQAAELFGFTSGEEMLTAIEKAETRSTLIERMADEAMRGKYGDLLTEGDLGEEAMKAIHDEKRGELLVFESRKLAARAGRRTPPRALIRENAQATIAKKRARDINPHIYQRAEARAAKAAYEAAAKGDHAEAFVEKQRELLNHELYRAALKAREEIDAIVEFMAQFDKKATRERLGKAGADYLAQIDDIMERFDFRRGVSLVEVDRRKSLAEWVKEQEAQGEPVQIDEKLLNDAFRKHYKDATFEELKGIRDAAKNIDHLSSYKNELILEKERRDADAVKNEVAASILENAPLRKPDPKRRELFDKLRKFGKEALGSIMNADTLTRELDGFKNFGPVYRHVKGVVDKAVSEKLIPMQNEAGEAMDKLYTSAYSRAEVRKMGRERIYIPEVQGSLTKQEILSIALNWGNEGNREALTKAARFHPRVAKERVTEADIQAIISRLDKRDWDFVQSVWDYLETFWPAIAEAQQRRTGLPPEKVAATEIVTPFGTYRGGYYPLKYSAEDSTTVSEESIEESVKFLRAGRFGRAQTARGHTIERIGSGGRPVMLDLSVFNNHVNKVIHDLALGDAVNYSVRVLHSKRVRNAFENTGNVDAWNALDVWLQDTAAGEMVAGDFLSKGLRWLRTGLSVSSMGWNLSTALIQPTGFLQSIVVLGPKYAFKGVAALLSRKWRGDDSVFAQVYELSDFMKSRTKTFNKDVTDTLKSMKGFGVFPPVVNKSMFWLMARTQQVVDVATWMGAYQKGLAELGNEADAIQFADRMVARAQASGLFSDRSAIERGTASRKLRQSETVKLFTTMMSYALAKANVAYERTRITDFKNPAQVLRWTMDMALLFSVEALLIAAIRGNWPDDDDDESKLGFVLTETGHSVLSTVPIVRDVSSALRGFGGGGLVGTFVDRLKNTYTQIEQGEMDAALAKNLNNLFGMTFHYPSTQLNRFFDVASRAASGDDVSLWEAIVGRGKKK